MFSEYIARQHGADVLRLLRAADPLLHYSLHVDFLKLFEMHPDVGGDVLCSPVDTLRSCDADLVKAQQEMIESVEHKRNIADSSTCSVKRNVHARFYGLPVCPELHRTIFPKNVDLECFLKVTGTVVRVTQSKMLEHRRIYVCVKCKHETAVDGRFEERYILRQPSKCTNTVLRCKSSTFTQINLVSREHCKDYQEIKIQEQVNKLSIGTIPGSMWVTLEDDLVDCCKPGDDLNICGTVRRRWRPPSASKKCEVELVLQANYVEVCNSQKSQVVASAPDVKCCFDEFWGKFQGCPMKGRDCILASVCPQVYGLHLVKLALLLTVITGSSHIPAEDDGGKVKSEDQHPVNVRGQCHLLLVGDPGTGKSQLLKAGVELTPRSVFTSGTGSTRAGLTCSALREDGEWQLEAGALVLSDGGVCCIDEIGQLREHDRTSIHEAMEQQTISIAKAGIVCKLNTRCAVIGACNPKGHYQTDQPLSVNVSLGTPLLSRFDLIFVLLDSKNEHWDRLVSSYILFGSNSSSVLAKSKQWNIEKLQMYISAVGQKCTVITKSANTILQTYYMMQRKSEHRDPSRTTVRMLDSLVRLSQAHSRLMYRNTVLPMDAITAISLVDLSMQDCTLRDTADALHSTFPKYPDFQYLVTAKQLLARMSLYEIWNEELLYYSKLLKVDHKTLGDEIYKESYKLFMKFDEVQDDNIALSCSLVTSSYFNKNDNNCNEHEGQSNESESGKDTNVRKLAANLKNHSSFNKPVIEEVKGKFRKKRKAVTIVSETVIQNKSVKNEAKSNITVKKNQLKNKNKRSERIHSDSEDEDVDPVNILNNVPSVNDIFVDMNINFNIDQTLTNENENNVNSNICKFNVADVLNDKDSSLTEKPFNIGNEPVLEDTKIIQYKDNNLQSGLEIDQNVSINLNTSVRENKLNKFQFIENRDLNKFYEPKTSKGISTTDIAINAKSNDTVMGLSSSNKTKSNASQSLSNPSSQISMFESSYCEIDLEL